MNQEPAEAGQFITPNTMLIPTTTGTHILPTTHRGIRLSIWDSHSVADITGDIILAEVE